MRTLLTVLTTCCFALPLTAASADEPVKKAVVRELDLKELTRKPSGQVLKPAVIANIQELSKCSGLCFKEQLLYQLAKQVDFEKEKLLFFAWSGSQQDKLTFECQECKVMRVRFHYQRGLADEARPHVRLIVVPKNTHWSVTDQKPVTK